MKKHSRLPILMSLYIVLSTVLCLSMPTAVFALQSDNSFAEYYSLGQSISSTDEHKLFRLYIPEKTYLYLDIYFSDAKGGTFRLLDEKLYISYLHDFEESSIDPYYNASSIRRVYTLDAGMYFIEVDVYGKGDFLLNSCTVSSANMYYIQSTGRIEIDDNPDIVSTGAFVGQPASDNQTNRFKLAYQGDPSALYSDVYQASKGCPTSSAVDASCMPTYVYKNNQIQMLYNPYGAELSAYIYKSAQNLNNKSLADYNSWAKYFLNKGYSQLYCIIDSELYAISGSGIATSITKQSANIFSQHLDGVVGIRKLTYNGVDRYNVAIAIRGTKDIGDVLTDIGAAPKEYVGTSYHSGFLNCALEFEMMLPYIVFDVDGQMVSLEHILYDMQKRNSKYTMFFSGHSLGGAIVNNIAGTILDEVYNVDPSNYVAYTFASPNTIYSENYELSANIFNLIHCIDFVPKVPFDSTKDGYNITFYPDTSFYVNLWRNDYEQQLGQVFSKHIMDTYAPINEFLNGKVISHDEAIKDVLPFTTEYIADDPDNIFFDRYCFLDCDTYYHKESYLSSDNRDFNACLNPNDLMNDYSFRKAVEKVWALEDYSPDSAQWLLDRLLVFPSHFGWEEYFDYNAYTRGSVNGIDFAWFAETLYNINPREIETFQNTASHNFFPAPCYNNGEYSFAPAGWGEFDGVVCGVKSAESNGDLIHVILYGTDNLGANYDNYWETFSALGWGTPEANVPNPVYWSCDLIKKNVNGTEIWTLVSRQSFGF